MKVFNIDEFMKLHGFILIDGLNQLSDDRIIACVSEISSGAIYRIDIHLKQFRTLCNLESISFAIGFTKQVITFNWASSFDNYAQYRMAYYN